MCVCGGGRTRSRSLARSLARCMCVCVCVCVTVLGHDVNPVQEYEMPYPLQKDAGEEEDAWVLKDGKALSCSSCVLRFERKYCRPRFLRALSPLTVGRLVRVCRREVRGFRGVLQGGVSGG